tara:strand:+ start:1192 stop:1299 length:108 start_codon:yes stop_codon:yes gene_type:complete
MGLGIGSKNLQIDEVDEVVEDQMDDDQASKNAKPS